MARIKRELQLKIKKILMHPRIAQAMLTVHIIALCTIITIQLMAMRQERLFNIQQDGGVSFLGGSQQLILDDKQFFKSDEAKKPAQNEDSGKGIGGSLSNNMTDLLGDLDSSGSGIDEFVYRSRQTYEEMQEVKRFFNVDQIKRVASPEAGQSRLRMDKLLDHIVEVFNPLYDYRKSYVPYIPQKPIRVTQFRTT